MWIADRLARTIAAVRAGTATSIDLYDNGIGDEGARALADAAAHSTHLTTLRLKGNDHTVPV